MLPLRLRARLGGPFLALMLQCPSLPARVPPGTEVGRYASNWPVLVEAITPEADLSDVIFHEGVDLSGVRFEQVNLSGAILKGVNLEQAVFMKGCWTRPVDFSSARLAKATFQRVDIHEADFRLADLTGADFSTCLIRKCQREGAIETGTCWRKPHPLAPAGAGDPPAWGQGAGGGSGQAPDRPGRETRRITGKRKRDEPATPAGPPRKKPRRVPWESNLAKLVQYQAAKGHTHVSAEDDLDLSLWVADQHVRYRLADPGMKPERSAALEKVPTWQWKPRGKGDLKPQPDVWDTYLAALKAYAATHGTTQMRTDHREGTLALGRWVSDQRSLKKRKAVALTPDRIAALEEVPAWEWLPSGKGCGRPQTERWDSYLAALKAYAAAHGTTRMGKDHQEGTVALGRWVKDQRSLKRNQAPSLTPERIAALEAVPHWEW